MLILALLIAISGCASKLKPIKLVETPCAERPQIPAALVEPPEVDNFLKRMEETFSVIEVESYENGVAELTDNSSSAIISDYMSAQQVVNQYNACRATLKIIGDIVE